MAEQKSRQESVMEEVWKDINLASLHECPSRDDPTSNSNFRGLTFEDLLSRPIDRNPPPTRVPAGYGCPLSPPATAPSLNSGPDQINSLLIAQPISNAYSPNVLPFDALASSSSNSPAFGKRSFPEPDSNPGGDRRHKRMIKNRESAARSRARKQVYTNELERKVAHLMKENAILRQQLQVSRDRRYRKSERAVCWLQEYAQKIDGTLGAHCSLAIIFFSFQPRSTEGRKISSQFHHQDIGEFEFDHRHSFDRYV